VSAKAMPSEQAAGMRAGADDYITKPFDEVELLQTLRRFGDPCPKGSESIEVLEAEEGEPSWNN
jgi:DNA-binding response OmpR family regulator